jgi:hypothetical protein
MDFLRLPNPWPGFTVIEEHPDRVFLDDAGQIWILAGRDEWFNTHPKPFIFSLKTRLTVYELVMAFDERHPYAGLGDGAKDEGQSDIRLRIISLFPRRQKFFDTIIRAYRARRLKSVPTSWSEEADETRLTLIVADGLEVILDELADELAALGDGGVIGALRTQRDTAAAEREALVVAADKGQDDEAEPARSPGKPPRRSGPKPGSTGYAAIDEDLFTDIDRMLENGAARSPNGAALSLALAKKVSGQENSSPESRAARLARNYRRWKAAPAG